jgi:hypothetical protein
MYGILFLVGLIIIVPIMISIQNKNKDRIEKLHNEYKEVLKGTNKSDALNKGRAYYYALGSNAANAESIISNDLKGMDEAYKS